MLPMLLPALGLAAVASAQWSSASTEYSFDMTCSTAYGSTWVAPIPTSYWRTSSTISSSAPMATYTSTVYVTANTTIATPITLWTAVLTTTTLVVDATTSTVSSNIPSTIATLTTKTTVCADGGPAPSSTVTEYAGTYTPVPGQDTVLPASYETFDSCSFSQTEIQHIFPTTAGPTVTTTIPFTTASPTIWTTETNIRTVTAYRSTVTVTVSATSYYVALTTSTVSSCAAAPTVTYAARCAPQNLIAEFDGVGLSIGSFDPSFVFGGVYDTAKGDPSLCCQLCVENAGCVASVYWAQSSACLLGYVGGDDKCPVAFDYFAANYTEVPTKPRQGNIFQTGSGCGSIKYDGVHDK